jgi:hypothetical protein
VGYRMLSQDWPPKMPPVRFADPPPVVLNDAIIGALTVPRLAVHGNAPAR